MTDVERCVTQTRRARPQAVRAGSTEQIDHQATGVTRNDTASDRLDAPELLAEVYRLVRMVIVGSIRRDCKIPGVGTPEWWRADDQSKIAGLLVLSQAWCVHDPDRAVRERLREMSYDLSEGLQDQRELIRRRRDAIGRALRNGDGHRAVELTNHHVSDQWFTTHPMESGAAR